MLMLSRSFSTPSMFMVKFSILGYLGCDIVGDDLCHHPYLKLTLIYDLKVLP